MSSFLPEISLSKSDPTINTDWTRYLSSAADKTNAASADTQVGNSNFTNSFFSNIGSQRVIDGNNMSFTDWLLGGKTQDGSKVNSGAMGLLGLAKTGLNAYTGYKELKLAEDIYDFQKDAFTKQFNAQKALTNDQLAWQHQAREDRLAGSGGDLVQI